MQFTLSVKCLRLKDISFKNGYKGAALPKVHLVPQHTQCSDMTTVWLWSLDGDSDILTHRSHRFSLKLDTHPVNWGANHCPFQPRMQDINAYELD